MVKATVKGINIVNDKLDQLLAIVGSDELQRVVDDVAKDIQEEAKQNAPVKTGRLRRNIFTTAESQRFKIKNGADIRSKALDSKTRVNYAPFQEFGTKYLPEIRYLGRAGERHLRNLVSEITDLVRDVIIGAKKINRL